MFRQSYIPRYMVLQVDLKQYNECVVQIQTSLKQLQTANKDNECNQSIMQSGYVVILYGTPPMPFI